MTKPNDDKLSAAELLGLNDESTPRPPAADTLAEALEDVAEADAGDMPEHSLHPILTNAEVLAIRQDAKAAILAKRVKAAKQALLAEETERLAREEGLIVGDGVKDELVKVTLDLAEHSDKIVLSGRPYYHGHTYDVPRHVADTLREIQSRGHDHQRQVDGKPREDLFKRPHLTVFNGRTGAVQNAPQRVA